MVLGHLNNFLRSLLPFAGYRSRPLVTVMEANSEMAVLGLGCFWYSDALFGAKRGVKNTSVGYAGGTSASPTYRNIGDHIEVVRIIYDPSEISFEVTKSRQ